MVVVVVEYHSTWQRMMTTLLSEEDRYCKNVDDEDAVEYCSTRWRNKEVDIHTTHVNRAEVHTTTSTTRNAKERVGTSDDEWGVPNVMKVELERMFRVQFPYLPLH
jgi:hypothetical protein